MRCRIASERGSKRHGGRHCNRERDGAREACRRGCYSVAHVRLPCLRHGGTSATATDRRGIDRRLAARSHMDSSCCATCWDWLSVRRNKLSASQVCPSWSSPTRGQRWCCQHGYLRGSSLRSGSSMCRTRVRGRVNGNRQSYQGALVDRAELRFWPHFTLMHPHSPRRLAVPHLLPARVRVRSAWNPTTMSTRCVVARAIMREFQPTDLLEVGVPTTNQQAPRAK